MTAAEEARTQPKWSSRYIVRKKNSLQGRIMAMGNGTHFALYATHQWGRFDPQLHTLSLTIITMEQHNEE